MACEDQITTQDLINSKLDAVTLGEVATSRLGAEIDGAPIAESTNRFSETTDTVQGRLNKLGVIFDNPIRDWSASLVVSDLRAHRYPPTTGDIYIPTKPLPFTTDATFNTDSWALYNGENVLQVNNLIKEKKPVSNISTLQLAIDEVDVFIAFDGASANIAGRNSIGDGGGAMWDYVLASGVTPNTYDIVQCVGVPTLALVLRKNLFQWFPAQFGLVSNDATNSVALANFEVLNYISNVMVSYMSLEFDGGVINLAHDKGYSPLAINGYSAMNLQSLKSVRINGNGSCIKVTDHNLAVNNGLIFLSVDAVQTIHVSGFTSRMSFINRNNSATYYPNCGFSKVSDTLGTETSRTFDELSSDLHFYNLVFDNFHPEGSFGEAQNSFPGDPNNGFKIYGVTLVGDTLAVDRENQNSSVTFRDNVFLPTHNGYGFWVWAYNNVEAHSNKATQYNSWASNFLGVTTGSSIPMIRSHQWYCSGYNVHDNQFTSRDIEDRIDAYQGSSVFCHAAQNGSFEWQRGMTNINNNQVSLRTNDVGVFSNVYGLVNINDNTFEGVIVSDRPRAAIDIGANENGKAWYNLDNNNNDENFSGPLVRIEAGASTEGARRIKSLKINNCDTYGSFGSVISFTNTASSNFRGIEKMEYVNSTADASNSEFNPANSNGSVILSDTWNVATDRLVIRNNTIDDFYAIDKSGTQIVISEGNEGSGGTASTSYNFLPINRQDVNLKTVVAGVIPRVGIAQVDFFSFSAEKRSTTTGLVLLTSSGQVAGGSSLATATPVGEVWYITETLIASKVLA